jgi:hypothetical protein
MRKSVIRGEFLTWLNRSYALAHHVVSHDLVADIRIATMINEFCPTAADRSVNPPKIVEFDNVLLFGVLVSSVGFNGIDQLSNIVDHVAAGGYALFGEYSESVNTRLADAEAKTGALRVDAGLQFPSRRAVGFWIGVLEQPELASGRI